MNKTALITAGDITGIAPYIIIKSWLQLHGSRYNFFVATNYDIMQQTINKLKLDVPIYKIKSSKEVLSTFQKYLPIYHIEETIPENLAIQSIDIALAMLAKEANLGMITAPVNKRSINNHIIADYKIKFRGHTEYIGQKTQSEHQVMMMATADAKLKVVPITTHIGINSVSSELSIDKIITQIMIVNNFLIKKLGILAPKMAMAGLNPHCGDDNLYGNNEEDEIIKPAINIIKNQNIDIEGPLSADSLFIPYNKDKYNVIFGCYHDQVLAPFKALYFDEGVNVTLGIPYIRTSPDHGVAKGITYNQASPTSLISAIKLTHKLLK